MENKNKSWLILFIVLFGCFLTRPSHTSRLEAVDAQFTAKNPILGMLQFGKAARMMTKFEDYGFASALVNIQEDGTKNYISIGFCNHVIVRNFDLSGGE